MGVFEIATCPGCATPALNKTHFGWWVFSLLTPPVRRRGPCVLTWQGGPEFIWCGTGYRHTPLLWSPRFTHEHHTALILSPPLMVSWLAKQRGCPDFPASLVLEGLHQLFPRLSTPLNPMREKAKWHANLRKEPTFAQMQSDTSLVMSKH